VRAGEQYAFAMGDRVPRFDHIHAEVGARIPWHTGAIQFLVAARAVFGRSHVALIDYGTRTTTELAQRAWRDWLRTYRDHGRGKDPLRKPGTQDITSDVAFDQLAPQALTTQADWLRGHGIEDLVATARATWRERASIGDLAALKARSRVSEAEALLDPSGPGGFLVAEWNTPA
jgi:SAM-dependent MidA family methyltransferase